MLARDLHVARRAPRGRAVGSRTAGRAVRPGCWTFGVDGLVGATPELLVRPEQGLVTSRVLAGTIRRTGDDAATWPWRPRSPGPRTSRSTSTPCARCGALVPFCSAINVPEMPFVLDLPQRPAPRDRRDGRAPTDERPRSTLAAALHPTAAVCGTPTDAARRAHRRSSPWTAAATPDRSAGSAPTATASGVSPCGAAGRRRRPAAVRLFAGCGIVAGSDPDAEAGGGRGQARPDAGRPQGDLTRGT